MAKIDEIKELLNSLRIWLSITVGLMVVVCGGLISRFDNAKIDLIFWLGSFLFFIFLFVIVLLIVNISKRTKEIGRL